MNSTLGTNHTSLTGEDLFAGLSMTLTGVFGIFLHLLESSALLRLTKTITGFVLVLPLSLVECLLLIQYAILPGLVTLTKNEIIPESWRIYFGVYSGSN